MQNMGWKLLLILFVIGLCGLSLKYKEMRLGTDLQGGTSLIYVVEMPPTANDPKGQLQQIIEVLKQRVNPKGVYDISMEPLGRDRIEIIMPLPNDEVLGLKKDFEDALESLLEASEISARDLDQSIRAGTLTERFSGEPDSDRGRAVATLQSAVDAQVAATSAVEALRAQGASEQEMAAPVLALARANRELKTARRAVLDLSLGEGEMRRVLALSTAEQVKTDAETGEETVEKSARAIAVEQRKADYPGLAGDIDTLIAAYDAYQAKRRGLDDPEDLKRLLRGAGVLEFHIAVQHSEATDNGIDIEAMRDELRERGPGNSSSAVAEWAPINQLQQWYEEPSQLVELEENPESYFQLARNMVAAYADGQYYLLLYKTPSRSLTHDDGAAWKLSGAESSVDSFGRPCVAFQLDTAGSQRMAKLTGGNKLEPMAIVLDGEVYSAPTIQGVISSSGQITGSFSPSDISYLIRVLNAGSLSARLSPEPISTLTLGPSLGQENLDRGREAFVIAIIAVVIFMLVYYFFAGLVADLALAANGVIIFGAMMGIDGTFTLPGLAGIILTIGMAVDANVLIYERIREEIIEGELDLKGCIRQGYGKALSTILDGNVTNLIVCLVLFWVATTEIKGFALTLTIGICATLFTALFVTRQVYYFYTDVFKKQKLNMLPVAFPAVHRALEPNIKWISMRHFFWAFSAVAVTSSIVLVYTRGVNMLDTEFRGGVAATMSTVANDDGTRLELAQSEVEARLIALAEGIEPPAENADPETRLRLLGLSSFADVAVTTVGDTTVGADGSLSSSQFAIKVANPKGLDENQTITDVVMNAIIGEFEGQLDIAPSLTFEGAGDRDDTGHVLPIDSDSLSEILGRADAIQDVSGYNGGAAVLVTNVTPAVTVEDVQRRIERMRGQPDFVDYSARKFEVYGLRGASDDSTKYVDFAVVVRDEHLSYFNLTPDAWYDSVGQPEWELVTAALNQPASLDNVNEYSSAVAETLKANATVAVILTLLGILVYIWIRFGSLRYSFAAIAALVHDVSIALGLLALSTIIGGTALGEMLLIEPFRINLGVVAALLTIIGYSLNDTIVILDRIRENRGKRPLPTEAIVNRSINQTVSRTLLTSFTTVMAVLIMYIEGGGGIRSFTYCLLAGLLVGTYSSVAIAAPLVFSNRGAKRADRDSEDDTGLTTV